MSFLACFGHISIRIMLKNVKINRERRKIREKLAFWHKKIIGPRPLGGRAPGAPPWIR